ncbi:Do family serine endopeptidase [Asticcacaulis sp. BYS171W]|uniref:Do family serine endopeptidase n=1 Tax=Asticcacaulis aquaticus TaxID=2984212 RepID=A0ABT5HUD7_9CAUL|nr:Do family serine endopeptidase [Asticcacaulis aquaticus]MDC7683659.1 Do family serine endopeptidase [Asticcacaulis aquaticus]
MGKLLTSVKTHKGMVAGIAGGLMLGAAVAGAAVSGMGQSGYDGSTLIKTAAVKPMKPPAGAPMSFADIIERVSPAVVSIETKGKVKMPAGIPIIPGFEPPAQGEGDEQEVRGAGSGFFITADGYVVTNNHVIDGADEITVVLNNESKLKATVIGRDPATDLAVLKVDGKNFPYVEFETTQRPRVGDWVIAVGNPFGLSGTATAGIVSAFGRPDGAQGYVDYMQIDAAINRGNSGGPTFDLNGRVIGVNSAIITPSGGNAGVGFAIPADTAYAITQKLRQGGKVERGYIGVGILPVTDEYVESLSLSDKDGAYISDITKGGPAEKGGVQLGDIVKTVNGKPVKIHTDLTRNVANVRPGEKVEVEVLRNGKLVKLTIVAALRPSEDILAKGVNGGEGDKTTPNGEKAPAVLGLSVKPIDPAARKEFSIEPEVNGVVITAIEPTSDGAKKGLKPGDVIVRANNLPVASRADFDKIVADMKTANRPSILLLVNRAGRNIPLPLSLK